MKSGLNFSPADDADDADDAEIRRNL